MKVVTIADAWPKPGEPFRVEIVPSRLVAKLRSR